MQIRSMIKTALINVAIFIGLMLGLLFVTAALGDGYNLAKSLRAKDDKRAELPSYDDHAKARAVFRDQKGRIKNYVPFVEWRHTAHASTHLNVDADGRRIHTIGREEGSGAKTLGFFGGSTVWGTGVDDNGTLPAQFDAITEGYRVTNDGERGYTTMQNLIDLMTLINERRAPDIVVFYEGYNDVWVHCDASVTNRLNSHMEEHRMQSALDRTANENYLYNTILAPIIAFVARVSGGGDAPHQALCSTDPERAEAVAEMVVRTLEMAQAIVAGNGGTFHAFLQPSAFTGRPRTDHLGLGGQRDQALRAQFDTVYPLIIAGMKERGHGWFTDLSDALDGDDYLLIDYAHVTAKGNAILAERIRNAME